MKTITLFLLTLLSIELFSQEIALSPFKEKDREEAIENSYKIISILNDKSIDNLDIYLSGTETNINGQVWLKHKDFKGMLSNLIKNKTYLHDTLVSYTFDEVINSQKKKEFSKLFQRTFNSNNILVTGKYIDLKDSTRYDFSFVFGKSNNGWKISSFHFSDVNLVMKNTETLPNHRIENLTEIGLEIPIPKNFSEKQLESEMITYILEGETPRDAVIQIFSGELKAPIEFFTYKWAEYIALKKYNYKNFIAKLHPNGIIYEYILTDQDGNENKGISVGLEKDNKVIIIQYFSFEKTYDEIWIDIDLMIRKLKI